MLQLSQARLLFVQCLFVWLLWYAWFCIKVGHCGRKRPFPRRKTARVRPKLTLPCHISSTNLNEGDCCLFPKQQPVFGSHTTCPWRIPSRMLTIINISSGLDMSWVQLRGNCALHWRRLQFIYSGSFKSNPNQYVFAFTTIIPHVFTFTTIISAHNSTLHWHWERYTRSNRSSHSTELWFSHHRDARCNQIKQRTLCYNLFSLSLYLVSTRSKVIVEKPVVEIGGDEMSKVIFNKVKQKLIIPFVNLERDYYDLSLANR